MRLPSLRAIQAFDAVARHGSFSRAADELAVTHGAVSRQIRALEQQLDTPLFHRTAKGAALTGDGAVLFQASRAAFAALRGGVADLARRRADTTITLSLTTSLALKWLVPRLPAFRRRHPEIAVLLDTNDAPVDLHEQPVDCALRFGTGGWTSLHETRLTEEELVAVAAPGLMDGASLPLSPHDLITFPLVHDDYNPGWDRWLEKAGAKSLNGALPGDRYIDSGVLIAAALDGQAVALVRRLLAADDLAAGRLIQVSDVTLPLERSLFFVCRAGDQNRPVVAALRDWLTESFADFRRRP
ncbi:transcriptional regulator GcvA [Pelagibius sp.]|uniref:transcriptional regulator GcvA n=1 Tax=Pelagibius sp. TaxID=1931238 RepID=UPI002606C471|nr:transcriptional regulator GcvA [Pelagibius sp.]